MTSPAPFTLTADEARPLLVAHHRLARFGYRGAAELPNLLRDLRCIQLDPLNPIGTNADLVALARTERIQRGEVYRALYPGHAFEHFAKERCLLPAEAFPWYRSRAAETPWWRLSERLKRLPEGILEAVAEEVGRRGPISVAALEHRGKVRALDWSGWKGTANATRMAIEVLWTRCQIVVCGREARGKLYDVPEKALPHWAAPAPGDFEPWAILERAQAAGLLTRNAGPLWSMLSEARTAGSADRLVEAGALEEIRIEGSPRRYLALPGFRKQRAPRFDDRVRILGPLDPLVWDRALVKDVFGFDYVWEVYKPAAQRRWGWYVCPLLRRDRFIGRLEAEVQDGVLKVANLWRESDDWRDDDVDEALVRHAKACGADKVSRRKAKRG